MTITYRSATPADLPTLLQFEQGIITTERPFDPNLKPDPISYYDIAAMIPNPDIEVMVATNGTEVVGSAYVKIVETKSYFKFDKYAFLGFMFVKAEFRGKGISQAILERAKEWAKAQNLSELRLEVYDENVRAVRAYEKAGFSKRMVEMRCEVK
ncbi:MAG: N-acetyltransferase family protein [Saprospiraceae bacterium]